MGNRLVQHWIKSKSHPVMLGNVCFEARDEELYIFPWHHINPFMTEQFWKFFRDQRYIFLIINYSNKKCFEPCIMFTFHISEHWKGTFVSVQKRTLKRYFRRSDVNELRQIWSLILLRKHEGWSDFTSYNCICIQCLGHDGKTFGKTKIWKNAIISKKSSIVSSLEIDPRQSFLQLLINLSPDRRSKVRTKIRPTGRMVHS